MTPAALMLISLRRRNRVINRGEPGGRLNPRTFSALASVSMVTARPGDRRTRSCTTAMISSRGAVWGSAEDSAVSAATGGGSGAGTGGAA